MAVLENNPLDCFETSPKRLFVWLPNKFPDAEVVVELPPKRPPVFPKSPPVEIAVPLEVGAPDLESRVLLNNPPDVVLVGVPKRLLPPVLLKSPKPVVVETLLFPKSPDEEDNSLLPNRVELLDDDTAMLPNSPLVVEAVVILVPLPSATELTNGSLICEIVDTLLNELSKCPVDIDFASLPAVKNPVGAAVDIPELPNTARLGFDSIEDMKRLEEIVFGSAFATFEPLVAPKIPTDGVSDLIVLPKGIAVDVFDVAVVPKRFADVFDSVVATERPVTDGFGSAVVPISPVDAVFDSKVAPRRLEDVTFVSIVFPNVIVDSCFVSILASKRAVENVFDCMVVSKMPRDVVFASAFFASWRPLGAAFDSEVAPKWFPGAIFDPVANPKRPVDADVNLLVPTKKPADGTFDSVVAPRKPVDAGFDSGLDIADVAIEMEETENAV